MTTDSYNLQALTGLIMVNLFAVIWIGLVWAGRLKGEAADRVLKVAVFAILGVVAVHALISPVIAR